MSGLTYKVFDAVVFVSVHIKKQWKEVCIVKGNMPGMSYLLESVTYKHITYSKPTQKKRKYENDKVDMSSLSYDIMNSRL